MGRGQLSFKKLSSVFYMLNNHFWGQGFTLWDQTLISEIKVFWNVSPKPLRSGCLDRMGVGPVGLQAPDGPHGQVANEQEGDDLTARLSLHVPLSRCVSWGK